jgi:uncharacterized protein (TIGR02231 family)
MNRLLLSCSVFAVVFAAIPAHADDIVAESSLTAATVYMDRAALTRRAVVDIPAGAHTVVFEGLSAGLMPDSLRAEGTGTAKVTFGALSNKLVTGAELVAPKEKELNDQLLLLQDQRRGVEAEKQALTEKQNFLSNLSQQAGERSRENISDVNLKPDQWTLAAKTIHDEMAETLKGIIAQDSAMRGIDNQIQKIQQELGQLRTGQRNTYTVTLPLDAPAATRLTIDVSYQIPGATWSPMYDARLDTKTGKLDLIQYGAVRQNSGEDWTGISLTLSTAQPQRGTGLPDLMPFWISLYDMQPQMLGSMRMKNVASMEMAADSAVAGVMAPMPAAMPMEEKAEFAVATIETGGFVSEYVIPGPSTVKADGTESKLMVGAFETDSKMQVQIKPQMSTDAYLVARTTLKGESPVLPGLVNLFRDGAYVGQSGLPLLRPGEDQDLAFGVDDQVSVKRKVLKDERSEAGVINRDSVIEKHFITEIQNLHTMPVDVSVLETIPASQDKQIRVEILPEQTTSGYKDDVRHIKGLLEWSLPMTSKEKKDVKLGWKVSWPKDKNLSGL